MKVGTIIFRSKWVIFSFLILLMHSRHLYVLGNNGQKSSSSNIGQTIYSGSSKYREDNAGTARGAQTKDLRGFLNEEDSERFFNLTVANVIDDLNLDGSIKNSHLSPEAQLLILRQFQSNLEERIAEERNHFKYKQYTLEQRIVEINSTISLRKKELAELDYRIKSVYTKAVYSIEKLQQSYRNLIKKTEETLYIVKKILFDTKGPEFKVKGYFQNLYNEYSKLSDNCITLIFGKLRYKKIISKVEDLTKEEIEKLNQEFFEMIGKFNDDEASSNEWAIEMFSMTTKIQRFHKITSLQKNLAENVESDRLHTEFDYDKYVLEIKSFNYYLRHQIELLNRKVRDLKDQIIKQENFKKEIDSEINDKKSVIDLITEITEREMKIYKFFIAKMSNEIKYIDSIVKTRASASALGGKK